MDASPDRKVRFDLLCVVAEYLSMTLCLRNARDFKRLMALRT